jgi:hypothetical protein
MIEEVREFNHLRNKISEYRKYNRDNGSQIRKRNTGAE